MLKKSMGITNSSWGVCGFTSSFYAMYEELGGVAGNPRIINASRAFNVLAEIKTYLRLLQAEGKATEIRNIETFCRSFEGVFSTFSVAEYCTKVSESVRYSDEEVLGMQFSIALPPASVKDYLQRMWQFDSQVLQCPPNNDPGGRAIIGMTHHGSTTGYNGLIHYMYRSRNGKIHSWGTGPYDTIKAAAEDGADDTTDWEIGWVIKL